MKLYELKEKYLEIAARLRLLNEEIEERSSEIQAAGGEMPVDLAKREEELLDQLDASDDSIEQKAERIAYTIRNLEGDAAVHEAEAAQFRDETERYQRKADAAYRDIEWLKGYVQRTFHATNRTEAQGDKLTVKLQRSSTPRILAMNPADPPAQFVRVVAKMPKGAWGLVQAFCEKQGVAGVEVEEQFMGSLAKESALFSVRERLGIDTNAEIPFGIHAVPELDVVVKYSDRVVIQ